MKRLIVLMLSCVLILLLGVALAGNGFAFAESKTNQVYVYKVYLSALSELEEMPEDAAVLDLGFCYEVTSKNPIKTFKTNKTMGYTTVFKCQRSDIARLLSQNGINVQNSYQIDGCQVFEGYVKKGMGESQKVQVAYNLGFLSIGSPVIFGSY